MSDRDLMHWHGRPSELRQPPECCAEAADKALSEQAEAASRKRADAVHAERRRVVLAALGEIERYANALASVLPGDQSVLATKILNHVVEAVRSVGCICPMVDITQLNDPYPRQVPGGDARCGLHGVPSGLSRESNPASPERTMP